MEINRAVVLMGPRRVGKTVMVYQSIAELIKENISPRNILYIPLDNPLYVGLSLQDILLALFELNQIPQNETAYLFFDEIQYLRDWEIHLKSLVDAYPQHRFIATGSAAAALRLKSNESGAGRLTDFTLPPLTFYEYMKFIGVEECEPIDRDIEKTNQHFVDYINFGGYPEAVFSEEIKKDLGRFIKSDVIEKVLLRDLPSLYGINDIHELNRLFVTLARNTGQEVSLSGLSQGSGVVKSTISKYLEYLEAAFLIMRVRRVDKSFKRFQRDHTFKVYLTNSSMYAALFGVIDEASDNGRKVMGSLVETTVFNHALQMTRSETLFYARWKNGEVDLVSMDITGTKIQGAIEVKWSDRPFDNLSEIKGLLDFADQHKLGSKQHEFITCLTRNKSGTKLHKKSQLKFMPASQYCLDLRVY